MYRLSNVELNELLEPIDVYKGSRYWSNYVRFYDRENEGDKVTHIYKVRSESSSSYYDVVITLNKGKIVRTTCDCMRYQSANSCKHIAAVLINKYDEIMRKSISKALLSEQILSLFYNKDDKVRKIKKELKLTIDLSFDNDYYGTILVPNIKIGYNKMYNFNNKFHKFYEVYDGIINEYNFGKEFTYSKDEYYFSSEDKKIIDFLRIIKIQNDDNYYRRNQLVISDNDISEFLELIKNKSFTINGKKYNGIKKSNPYNSSLKKENNVYKFSINTGNVLLK